MLNPKKKLLVSIVIAFMLGSSGMLYAGFPDTSDDSHFSHDVRGSQREAMLSSSMAW